METSCEFAAQNDADTHSLNKTRLWVASTEGTNRIYDLIHLSQGHTIHSLI